MPSPVVVDRLSKQFKVPVRGQTGLRASVVSLFRRQHRTVTAVAPSDHVGDGQPARDIQEGDFDYVLTRPVDSQLLTSVRELSVWQLADVLVGIAIVAVAAQDLPSQLAPGDLAVFLAVLAEGATIGYCLWLMVACIAFWVVQLPFMEGLFLYVARAAQYPISIYPGWLRVGLTVIVPLGIAVTAPVEAITSRLSWGTAAVVGAVTIGCLVLSRFVWRRGVRRYSGASA